MATITQGSRRTFKAAADLTAKQFCMVKLNSDLNEVVPAVAATDPILGVLMNAPAINGNADVILRSGGSTAKVKAAATITYNQPVTSDANGAAVVAASGNEIVGYALHTAAIGDIIEIVLACRGTKA